MKIYYAHPMSWYNTKEEQTDLEAIRREYPDAEIINPNDMKFEAKVQLALIENRNTMEVFTDYIRDNVDMVIYRPFRDGMVGAGVAREALEAYVSGKNVRKLLDTDDGIPYVWYYGALYLGDVLTVADTKRRIQDGTL